MRLLLITDDELDELKRAVESERETASEEAQQATLGSDEYLAHDHSARVLGSLGEYLSAELDDDERAVCGTLARGLVKVTHADKVRAERGHFAREPEAAA